MPLTQTPTVANCWTSELEMARALYANGDYDEALEIVGPLTVGDGVDTLTRVVACQLKACVHSQRQEWHECLDALAVSGPLVDELPVDLRGKFHGQRALAYRNLTRVDDALIEYEAARVCAVDAGDERTVASIRNNVAKIYSDADRVDEAIAEVDVAIRIAIRLDDNINLGRYYDNKAQILIRQGRFSEALTSSKKAIGLLASHPAGVEARSTHGLAMIGVGAGYLDDEPRSIEMFRARHDAAKMIDVELNVDLIKTALTRSGGHVLGAARLLHVSHSVLIKLIARHKLERVPKRRRTKTLIRK